MGKMSKKPRAAPAPVSAAESSTPPLGKFLASTGTYTELGSSDRSVKLQQEARSLTRLTCTPSEKSVRDKAIQKLAGFLSRGEDGEEGGGGRLSPKEMQKLWKGLFYCE